MKMPGALTGVLLVMSVGANAQTTLPQGALPASVIEQAKEQMEGNFPPLFRPERQARATTDATNTTNASGATGATGASGASGGQIQGVWNKSRNTQGAYRFEHCGKCIYKVRTREFMITSIMLPKGTVITEADLGDPGGFEVKVRADNIIAVRPRSYGMDSNLNVYTASGEIYAFYIRSESFNSNNVPDVLVTITPPFNGLIEANKPESAPSDNSLNDLRSKTLTHKPTSPVDAVGTTDFIKTIEFDPGNLHGWDDYTLWGDDALKPDMVFRDHQFTYIQFGDNQAGLELPTAYVVIDGIDELVNTRVQGNTYIIENTARLITLKSGAKFMCLQFDGDAS
jgi:ComB9 competence protein